MYSGRSTNAPSKPRKELEAQVGVLQVAKAELDHLKADRAVYQRRGNIFFLSDKTQASKIVSEKLTAAKAELDQVTQGVQ